MINGNVPPLRLSRPFPFIAGLMAKWHQDGLRTRRSASLLKESLDLSEFLVCQAGLWHQDGLRTRRSASLLKESLDLSEFLVRLAGLHRATFCVRPC